MLFAFRHNQRDIVSAEAKRVIENVLQFSLLRDVSDVVEVAQRVWVIQIDRRRHDTIAHRENTNQ